MFNFIPIRKNPIDFIYRIFAVAGGVKNWYYKTTLPIWRIGRLDEYQFDRNYLARNMDTSFDVSVFENADLYDFGQEVLMHKQGEITSYGAISGKGQELYSALTIQAEQQLDEDFEEDYEENLEMEMGGLQ